MLIKAPAAKAERLRHFDAGKSPGAHEKRIVERDEEKFHPQRQMRRVPSWSYDNKVLAQPSEKRGTPPASLLFPVGLP
jgi:hypothetical protein